MRARLGRVRALLGRVVGRAVHVADVVPVCAKVLFEDVLLRLRRARRGERVARRPRRARLRARRIRERARSSKPPGHRSRARARCRRSTAASARAPTRCPCAASARACAQSARARGPPARRTPRWPPPPRRTGRRHSCTMAPGPRHIGQHTGPPSTDLPLRGRSRSREARHGRHRPKRCGVQTEEHPHTPAPALPPWHRGSSVSRDVSRNVVSLGRDRRSARSADRSHTHTPSCRGPNATLPAKRFEGSSARQASEHMAPPTISRGQFPRGWHMCGCGTGV